VVADDIKLVRKAVTKTQAYYTASVAIISQYGEYTVHGWMYGEIITTPRGENGFGYDPIFIPQGYKQTLGELDSSIKRRISHRAKALKLAQPIIEIFYNYLLKYGIYVTISYKKI